MDPIFGSSNSLGQFPQDVGQGSLTPSSFATHLPSLFPPLRHPGGLDAPGGLFEVCPACLGTLPPSGLYPLLWTIKARVGDLLHHAQAPAGPTHPTPPPPGRLGWVPRTPTCTGPRLRLGPGTTQAGAVSFDMPWYPSCLRSGDRFPLIFPLSRHAFPKHKNAQYFCGLCGLSSARCIFVQTDFHHKCHFFFPSRPGDEEADVFSLHLLTLEIPPDLPPPPGPAVTQLGVSFVFVFFPSGRD